MQRITRRGVYKAICALAVCLLVIELPCRIFAARGYAIRYNQFKGKGCLNYAWFLVDKKDRTPHRGDFVEFVVADQMQPFYARGTHTLKMIAGVPGDKIAVTERSISVNGQLWGPMAHVQPGGKLWELGKRPKDYVRNEIVPAGHFCMLGDDPRSFDCRYWGYVNASQIIGRATPLW